MQFLTYNRITLPNSTITNPMATNPKIRSSQTKYLYTIITTDGEILFKDATVHHIVKNMKISEHTILKYVQTKEPFKGMLFSRKQTN